MPIKLAPYPSSLLTNLVGWYTLEEASGNRVEASGRCALVPTNSPTNATGLIGNAASFTAASSQYIQLPFILTPISTTRSFSLWIKPTSTALASGRRGILSDGTGADPNVNFQIELGNPTAGKIGLYQNGNSSAQWGTALTAGNWYHLVAIMTSTSGTLYVNGTSVVSLGSSSEGGNAGLIWLGLGYNAYYDGLIDEFGMWTRALTTAEIALLYNNGAGLTYANFA